MERRGGRKHSESGVEDSFVFNKAITYDEQDEDSDKDDAELKLEELVFGELTVKATAEKASKKRKLDVHRRKQTSVSTDGAETDDELQVDPGAAADEEADRDDDIELIGRESTNKKKPAWIDADDEETLVKDKLCLMTRPPAEMCASENEQYSELLKKRFKKVMGAPKWAEQKEEERSDEEDEMLTRIGTFVGKSTSLPQTNIDIHRRTHLNKEAKGKAILKAVEFHPKSQVAVVAGVSSTATIFQVDEKTNPKIQSVHFQNFPIHCAHFSHNGEELLVGSTEYSHLNTYDMMVGTTMQTRFPKRLNVSTTKRFYVSPDGKHLLLCGRFGEVHILASKSKECIGTLKMNGDVRAIAFNEDGSVMYTHGGSEVYVWDMKARQCLHRFYDHGCILGTALATSPNGQFLATGSDSGVVNIYETGDLLKSRSPNPLKAVMNLTTEVTQLKFNSTSELLVMNSSHKRSGTKLVHFPSMTTFSNFPGRHDLKFPNCIDISPHSGYLAVGNNVGTAYLFRVKHYSNF
ncbi:U3 small nucleolar RNA-associated protein 18 homolog [Ornithodoros turicata]|uniref:U3 small nucleolar RNA-associated protein 18 homolog n=1 Tax=Ornithodoros turicata TaxID=34597 RepID=UPI003138FBBF